jgi:hypothetical protein
MDNLSEIYTELKLLRQEMEIMNTLTAKRLAQLDGFVFGNGQVGAKVRLDRLEQINTRHKWVAGVIGSTTLILVVKAAWALVVAG